MNIDWLDMIWFIAGLLTGGMIVNFCWIGFERSLDQMERRLREQRDRQPMEKIQ